MIGLETTVTCATCGGPVEPVNVGKSYHGTAATTMVACVDEACRGIWSVHATMRFHGRRPRAVR